MPRSLRDLLGECLAAGGVQRIFTPRGAPLLGAQLQTHDAGDSELAALLADADGRLGPGPGAAMLDDGSLRISSSPGCSPQIRRVALGDELPQAVAEACAAICVELQLEIDLDAPANSLQPVAASACVPISLAPLPPACTLVLAGPGVLRSGAAEGLRALAARAGLGVANSWGAKGLFDWRSPHHMGTAGLQARDFELLGFAQAERIVAVGVDFDETPRECWNLARECVSIEPVELAGLARSWTAEPDILTPNDFMQRMSAVCLPLQREERFPLSPGRAVADLRALLAGDDLLVADPGLAGFWVARAFPTTAPGTVVVPARVAPGFAAAAAFVVALRGRRAIAVSAEHTDTAERVLALARRARLPLVLSVWGATPEAAQEVKTCSEHREVLRAALERGEVSVLGVPVDWSDTQRLIEVAGPVVAWSGLLC